VKNKIASIGLHARKLENSKSEKELKRETNLSKAILSFQ